MDETNLLIVNSSRPIYSEVTQRHYFKNSFHVYIINYGYLPNLERYHKQFVKILTEKTQNNLILNNRLGISESQREKTSHIIDSNVYKKNQNFRCVCCTKPNKNRFFMPDEKDYNQPMRNFFMGWITDQDQPLDTSRLNITEKSHTKNKQHTINTIYQHNGLRAPPHLEEYIMNVLNHLGPNRVKEYSLWFDTMCRVYSIHQGLFKVFDNWSQKAPNYDANDLKKYWNGLYQ